MSTQSPLATLETKAEGSARIATITINRPETRNALSFDLLAALHGRVDELLALGESERPVVVVVTGAGKAFCAGMDLKEVLGNPAAPLKLLSSLAELSIKLRTMPAVVVGKINGAAIGGGCGLATVCDFSITHADAKLGFPEVDLGVCPAVVAPWLVRRVGPGRARRILLAGGIMSGQQAHETGIVTDVVGTREELDGACEAMVKRLAGGGPLALRTTKKLLNELDGSMDFDVVRRGAELSAKVFNSPEAQATIRSKVGG